MNNKTINEVFASLQKEIDRRSPEQLDEYSKSRWGSDHKKWGRPDPNNPYWEKVLKEKYRQ